MTQKTSKAIYYQLTSSSQSEHRLVDITTKREALLSSLAKIVRDVKEKRKKVTEDVECEILILMVAVRECTIDFFEAIEMWQLAYTKVKRPKLLESDYLIKIVTSVDFMNSSHLRRRLNFRLDRGNILLLPRNSGKEAPVLEVGEELAKHMRIFASPHQEKLVNAYQLLMNVLPEQYYQQLVPLEDYLKTPWIPKIWVKVLVPLTIPSTNVLGNEEYNLPLQSQQDAQKKPTNSLKVSISKAKNTPLTENKGKVDSVLKLNKSNSVPVIMVKATKTTKKTVPSAKNDSEINKSIPINTNNMVSEESLIDRDSPLSNDEFSIRGDDSSFQPIMNNNEPPMQSPPLRNENNKSPNILSNSPDKLKSLDKSKSSGKSSPTTTLKKKNINKFAKLTTNNLREWYSNHSTQENVQEMDIESDCSEDL